MATQAPNTSLLDTPILTTSLHHTSILDTSTHDTPTSDNPTATNLIDHPHNRPDTPDVLAPFELPDLLNQVDRECPTIPFPVMDMIKTFSSLPAEMRDAIWKAVSPSGHDAIIGPYCISDGDTIDYGAFSSILCNPEVRVATQVCREALNAWNKASVGKLFMSLRDQTLDSFQDLRFDVDSIVTLWPHTWGLQHLFHSLIRRHHRGCKPVKTVYIGVSVVVCEPDVSPVANSQLGEAKFCLFGLEDSALPAFLGNCNARRRFHHSNECFITSLQEYWAEGEYTKEMRQIWEECVSTTDGKLSPELVPVVVGTERAGEIQYRAGLRWREEIEDGKLAYSRQTFGQTKEFFEAGPPHLNFRLLRRIRCSKCWPAETDYFTLLDAVAPSEEAPDDHTD